MTHKNVTPSERVRDKRRRQRNWAVFGALFAFVVLVYAITMVKIKLGYGG